MPKYDYQTEIVNIELPQDDMPGDDSRLTSALKEYSAKGYKLVSTETLRQETKDLNPVILLIFEKG